MVVLAKAAIEKTQSVTYKRYKRFDRHQEKEESLESFHQH